MITPTARTPRKWLRGIAETAAQARDGLLDRCGSVGTHRWRPQPVPGVTTVTPDVLPDVLDLHAEIFRRPGDTLARCSRLFPHTFYVTEEGAAVIGFCSCTVRPAISRGAPVLKARILAIGVHETHRGRGVARRMLERCMAELDRNGIASVDLFVDRENFLAFAAYLRAGLRVVGVARDVCSQGKTCYRMERTFSRT